MISFEINSKFLYLFLNSNGLITLKERKKEMISTNLNVLDL